MRTNRSRVGLCALIGLAAAGPAIGQDAVVPPEPLALVDPGEVTNNVGEPVEGWVTVRFTVLADGTTEDVRAIEIMPPHIDESAAIDAVWQWRFKPATAAGAPIDWYNNEAVVVFDVESIPLEPSPAFSQSYVEIDELIAAMELEDARTANLRALNTITSRLNEIGLGQMQATIINFQLEDFHAAYESVRRATLPDLALLAPDQLRIALEYRFALAGQLGDAAGALDTFARLEAAGGLEPDSRIATQAETIEAALAEGATIGVKARVDREPWRYTLSRRTFTIADIEGSVREIQVECDRRKTTLEYADEVDWTLPASWGACTIFVDARRDTQFTLYEFAD